MKIIKKLEEAQTRRCMRLINSDFCPFCKHWYNDTGNMSKIALNGYCIECGKELGFDEE